MHLKVLELLTCRAPIQRADSPQINQRDQQHTDEDQHFDIAQPPDLAERDRPSEDEDRFQVDGVTGLVKMNGTLSFFYKGDINAITRLISAGEISDLTIEDLTLEEIFMHYYE